MEYAIAVERLSKDFRTYKTEHGKKVFLASLRRKYYMKKALRNVSFVVKKGEIVMLLGENGSGKSTLIKTLVGILHPDSGEVRVLGMDPWKERIKIAWNYGMVSGAHGTLFNDLPAIDTFEYVRDLYEIPRPEFRKRLAYFIRILNLKDVYKKQVRTMSMGERMKCNFIASVLHLPKVVFMDEATIGMDLPSVINLREAILDMQKKYSTTFFMTTHIVDEVKALARRVIIIDRGRVVFDGNKTELLGLYGNKKYFEISFSKQPKIRLGRYGKVVSRGKGYVKLEIDPHIIRTHKINTLLNDRHVLDYNISDPDLSSVLVRFYKTKRKVV
ncbi:MAG: ATP-binding cassette domain-containing protein [Candidatus Micrarchaeota archaeon]|nr:ATP-binding cassette domain-containing protein [Candidatus Micrarchaeota archaeon]MDE1804294.1 ATP-binding cassette domain-containing protein [Candidatus Micrarchaeota archaeon]MDE1846859.1 ATP-binding cassette domain-containing protein [Candidatus Micrarchaeota archaeon]